MPMKKQKIILIALLFLMVVRLKPSMGGRLLKNGLFISPENPSAFDPKLNYVVQITGSGSGSGSDPSKDPKQKTPQRCGEPSTLAFRFKEKEILEDKMKESPSSEEVVLNVLVKGSERGNNGIRSAQRLAKSNHSPGVGHFQIFNTLKSPQESGVSHIQDQKRVSNKRVLKSTPSPGAGH